MTQAQATAAKKAVTKNTSKRAAQPKKIQTRRERTPEVGTPPRGTGSAPYIVDADAWRQQQAEDIRQMKAEARRANEPTYTKAHLYLTGVSVAAGFLAIWVMALLWS